MTMADKLELADVLGPVIGIVKAMPDTAAAKAEAAAEEANTAAETAQAAAEVAKQHGYGLSVSGTTLVVTEATGG